MKRKANEKRFFSLSLNPHYIKLVITVPVSGHSRLYDHSAKISAKKAFY